VKRAPRRPNGAVKWPKRAKNEKMKTEAEASASVDPAQRKAWIATLGRRSETGMEPRSMEN